MKLSIKVSRIMTRKVVYTTVPGSRRDVLSLMLKTGHMGLPVVKKGTMQLVGMITKENLIRNPSEEQVALLMDRDPGVVTPDALVSEAIKIMVDKRQRHVPVVDENRNLVGIVTVYDVISKIVAALNIKEAIKDYYQRKIPVVWDGTPLSVACTIMRLQKTGVLLVLDSNSSLVGILTEADLLRHAEVIVREKVSSLTAPSEGMAWSWDPITLVYIAKSELFIPPEIKVSNVMTRDVVTVNEYASVSKCAQIMAKYDYDQLPVVGTEGELLGLLYDTDLLKPVLKYLS